jgi:small subunit ribosomal protein S7
MSPSPKAPAKKTPSPTPPQPLPSDPLTEKFICCILRKGKKHLAKRMFQSALSHIRERTKEAPLDVFSKALLNATPLIEVRPRRIGGSVYQIPTEVPPKRQQSLSMRWILEAAKARKGATFPVRLAMELLDASVEQGEAVKKKEAVLKMAQANKAFAHLARSMK